MDKRFENYKPSPTSLLEADPEMCLDADLYNELKEKAHILEDAFKSFGIDVTVVDISHGASITRFELTVASGTKISSIFALEEDIQLAMAAYSVRIEAPVPGKNTIGIEIPNEVKEKVHMRNLVEKYEYSKSTPLTVSIGRDVDGRSIYSDLAKMPHLLIAGNMGSGTVMCYNTILTSLLVHSSPEDVRLILIDPKTIEFYRYKNIPHLLVPVINEHKKGVNALIWAVNEMQRRLKYLEECLVSDIKRYNEKYKNDPDKDHMPYILIVISELSELMIDYSFEVEKCLSRLAPLARAAGIHLILATQRPTSDVITSNVYNNIGSRIAFAVNDVINSKVILHERGAEKLLGQGDMLYFPVTSPEVLRVQGVFVSEEETEAVVNYLKNQYGAMYDESVIEAIDTSSLIDECKLPEKIEPDALFGETVSFVTSTGNASVSVIQRHFGIGYPTAARLIDRLEKEGIIGPFEGSKPRTVLVTEEAWLKAKNADIEAVVSHYVKLTRKGNALWGICPFHEEKTPSFAVLPDKRIFKCYGCGKGGNAIRFIMEKEQLNCADAIRFIIEQGLSEKLEIN